MAGLETRIRNRFTEELPGDPLEDPRPRQVLHACYSRVTPTPVRAPRLLARSEAVAAKLGLSLDDASWASLLAGNQRFPGFQPYAACYGGHQFGNWAGQLGDGRAITVAELQVGDDRAFELQLKGSGPTPYSRGADGRAVLRSSVREFLCSEAMHNLGVPSTRALSLCVTGDTVIRDMFYDGNPEAEPGAIVCRVAPTFLRFGNYQLPAARGDGSTLRRLLEFTLRHYSEWDADVVGVARTAGARPVFAPQEYSKDAVVAWLAHVAARTAEMVTEWMRVGFVHGVMNTDNMSILGVTIDYGPYGWLDDFDPGWTPNTTDAQGRRYRFGAQPTIAYWNLARLAEALLPEVDSREAIQGALDVFGETFIAQNSRALSAKLGLLALNDDDDPLVDGLYKTLTRVETDMTEFFRVLPKVHFGSTSEMRDDSILVELISSAWYRPDAVGLDDRRAIAAWLRDYAARAARDGLAPEARQRLMDSVNPRYVLRNYLAQEAIDKATEGDLTGVETLLSVLTSPYEEQPSKRDYARLRPDWARQRAGCSMLSCSS